MKWTKVYICALLIAILAVLSYTQADNVMDLALTENESELSLTQVATELDELSSSIDNTNEIAKRRSASARRVARKAKRAAKRAARKEKRAAKKAARKAKRAARKAKRAAKKATRKAKRAARRLARRQRRTVRSVTTTSVSVVKPNGTIRVSRKPVRRVGRRSIRSSRRSSRRTFKPKPNRRRGNKNKKFLKKLRSVVENEPEVVDANKVKDHWKWEKKVEKDIEKAVPQDPEHIKERLEKLRSDSEEICSKSVSLCEKHDANDIVNMKTCVQAKEACFQSKNSIKHAELAIKECANKEEQCAKRGHEDKGECLIVTARCTRHLSSVDYYADKTQKEYKKLRDMEFNDNEAKRLRVEALSEELKSKAVADQLKQMQKNYDDCKNTVKTSEDCLAAADSSSKCEQAKRDATTCAALMKQYDELKKKDDDNQSKVNKAKAERDAAEKAAGLSSDKSQVA